MLGARFLPPAVFRGGALALVVVAVVVTSLLWAGVSPASAQTPQKPAKPTGLSVATEQDSLDVSLDWDDTSGATSYRVRWRLAGQGNPLNAGITPTSSDADITVAKYGEWVVRVQACNADGCGNPVSETVTTMTAQTTVPPPAPTGLTVSAGTSWGELHASWTAPSGVTVTDYDLRYHAGSADPTDEADWIEEGESLGLRNPGTSTSATIARLRTDTVYRVQVRAASAVGEGAWSDSASARIDSTAPVLRIARVNRDGTELTLHYDDPLDSSSAPAHGRFSVSVDGSERTLWRSGAVTVSGTTVTINLGNPAVTVGQAVVVSYDAAAAAKPIKNLKGIKAPGISALAAINDRTDHVAGMQSEVETPEIVSTPSNDTNSDGTKDTYGAGAEIKVRHTFDENVTVDTFGGTPRLKIKLHATHGERWASYEGGSGTAALTFSYTVRSSDTSKGGSPETDAGIAVLENSLDTNGSWILSAATGRFVNPAHAGLDHDADHKVNGTLDGRAPRFNSAVVNQTTLIVTFDEDLDTSSVPLADRFCVHTTTPDGSARSFCGSSASTVSISTGNNAVVTVPLSIGVRSGETVKLSYTVAPANPLQDAAGNAVASFSGQQVTNYSKAPGLATGVWTSTGALGGSLDVNWTAPDSGETPTGYELRYYQGTEDPPAGREADWKEDEAGLPDPGPDVTSATIQGLTANTAYQVQVRAKTAAEDGPWSASASGITGSPSAGNNPPRVLIDNGTATGNVCSVATANGPVKREFHGRADSGASVSQSNMVDVSGRTNGWPNVCNGTGTSRWAPKFDDQDGDKLILSSEPHPVPAHVRVNPTSNFLMEQPIYNPAFNKPGRVWIQAQAAFRETSARAVRAKVTATDPHGASVSVRVFFFITAMKDIKGAPSLPEVDDLDASPVREFSHVLPAATGGDNFTFGDPVYYYAVSGLPEGLTFDPETRTISGTPTETGEFEVTYIADDPDTVGSAYLNPEIENTTALNDTASRTFTINVRPFIGMVRVTSAPTHDANGDGRNDTYGVGDKIAIDVEFYEPVEFDPGTGTTETNTVQLAPIRVGRDSDTSAGNLKTAEMTDVLNGGKTLRFQYTVQSGDNDPDGVSIGSFSGDDADKMLVLKGTATLTGLVSREATSLERAAYIVRNAVDEKGLPLSYVNGYLTTAGPKPTAAHVDGETLAVTFDEDLAALSAAELQSLTFLFSVQGADGTGGNRNAYQHPGSVAMRTDKRTLELTLGVAAREGETITLSYKLNNYVGPIEDTEGNMAPAFVHLMVTNNTGVGGAEGVAGAAGAAGAAAEVTLVSNTGQSTDTTNTFNNDQALAFTTGSSTHGYKLTSLRVPYSGSVPAASGHTISIETNEGNRPGRTLGTLAYGTVSGTTVTYTASGDGIHLDAGTSYFVFLNAITGSLDASVQLTGSNSEDSARADGWSLGDRGLWRLRSTVPWNTHNAVSWKIAMHGVVIVGPAPQPQLASVAGTKLKIVFDKALDDTSTESGEHFEVNYSDRDGNQRTIKGTQANVAISEKTVTVTLAEAVPPNVAAQVTYEPPTLSLKAKGANGPVAGFMGFKIETVYDTAVPELMQVAAAQTSRNPDGFRVALYYDEALDTDSVPATTDFGVTLDWSKDSNTGSVEATPNAVAVEGNTVILTVDLAKAPEDEAFDRTYTMADVSYTKGTNPIRDPAGNEAADVDEDDVAVEAAGTPALAAATKAVKGDEVKLVGNTAQTNGGNSSFAIDRAQAFTTGSNAEGYKLTKLRIRYVIALPTAASHTIKIHASNSSNRPGASLGTLSYGSASGFDVTYTAPGDGIALDAGTTYFAVLDFISSQGGTGSYRTTNSDAEDAGAAGWTLADGSFSKHMSVTAWDADVKSWKIALHGAALKPVPVTVLVPVVPATLVGNTEQTAGSPGPFVYDYSQAFTTGSNTDGYRLTSVTVPYNTAAPPSSSHTISIHASNSSDRPDASLGTLGYGTVSGQTVTYTAPGNGIALDAETTYFVVIDVSGSSTTYINLTSSDAEDAGASDGWSLADGQLWRSSGSSGTWSTFNDTWQIAIQGTAVTEPAPSEALLVSNTGQLFASSSDFTHDNAQAFTTGNNGLGYTLTSVTISYNPLGGLPPASSHTISVHASNSNNRPGTSLGTLAYGTVSGTTVTYTASGDGIALASGTTYFVVLDTVTASNLAINLTTSGAEDSGAAADWSIADGGFFKPTASTAWQVDDSYSRQIAIHGVVNYIIQIEKTLPDLEVDGASLTVTYDKSLDPTSLPDPDRFTLLDEDGISVGAVAAVAVAGKKLVLTLNGAVSPCEPAFTLSYSWSETEKNIRTFTGHEAPDIEAEPVVNAQADRCVNGRAVVVNGEGASGNSGGAAGSQGKQGKSLTLSFDRPLDMGKALKASAFGLAGVSGGAPPAVEEAAYTKSGAGVALVLARALESGETLTLGYTRQAGDPGLWDAAGNQIADFSGVAVPVRTSEAPAVTGVEVVSNSGSDGTYALGETVRVRVTFSEAVEVDTTGGAPRLRIDMDPAAHWGMKWATYAGGSGTAELVFAHEVVQPNESTQGIAVLADTLEANGGAIRSVSGGADAGLGHDGLDHDPAHKVDWRLARAANVPATGAATITGTAQVGETLTADASGISDGDGLTNATFSYQWLADDADISGATGSRYTLAAADEGKAVRVRVSFTDDAGNDEYLTSEATAAVEAAPVENNAATGAPAITGTAQVGETLTADTSGISDADGLDNAVFGYQWLSDDADISGATGSTYTLAADDEGKAVKVKVSFTDDAGNDETVTSEATSTVAAAALPPPTPTNLVVSDNGNGTLTLTWDAPDDDSVTGYQILRRRPSEGEGTLLVYVADTGSTETTWTDEDVTIGTRHVYRVKAINAAGLSGASKFDRATPASPPENNAATGAPTITGTAQVGETLTADTSGISDSDGLANAVFSYQWLADDVDISGATGSTYTLAAADEGKAVKVRVSFTDDAGNAETLTSVAVVAAAALTVSIENEATSHDGSDSFTFELRFSEEVKLGYQSLRDHVFTVTEGTVFKAQRLDKPSNIHWQITVQPHSNADVTVVLPVTTDCDAQGAICTKNGGIPLSNTVSVTVQGPPENSPASGQPAISGTAQVGETLTASTSGIADADGLDNAVFSYRWVADDADISRATGSTYTLAAADEGKEVKVKVSFTDDAGNDESLTSEATAAVAAAPVENSPATGAPAITGTAQVGETLTADTSGISDGDGLDNATFSYQWLADDEDISGATGSTYTLAEDDEGKAVKVRVSFTDDAGNEESLTSEATSTVAAAALPPPTTPTNLVVSDNGNGTLTLTWDAPDDDSVTGYQILRRRPTEGEKTLLVYVADTGSTDTTWTDEDVTIGIRHVYRVRAINPAGLSGASNFDRATPTSPQESNAAARAPTITGTSQVGETLTADTSGISEADGLDDAVLGSFVALRLRQFQRSLETAPATTR